MAQEEEVLGKAYDSRLMKRLLQYLRPYKGAVGISLVSFCSKLAPTFWDRIWSPSRLTVISYRFRAAPRLTLFSARIRMLVSPK